MAFFITTVRIPALAFIPFWFILQIIFAYIVPQSGGVAYLAHIGGFITGMGTGYVWRLLSQRSRFKLQSLKKNVVTRKERPRLEDVVARTEPEVIEGPNFYEVIAEVRGASDASDIHASYEFETGTLRINVSGSLNYEMQVKLPGNRCKSKSRIYSLSEWNHKDSSIKVGTGSLLNLAIMSTESAYWVIFRNMNLKTKVYRCVQAFCVTMSRQTPPSIGGKVSRRDFLKLMASCRNRFNLHSICRLGEVFAKS